MRMEEEFYGGTLRSKTREENPTFVQFFFLNLSNMMGQMDVVGNYERIHIGY